MLKGSLILLVWLVLPLGAWAQPEQLEQSRQQLQNLSEQLQQTQGQLQEKRQQQQRLQTQLNTAERRSVTLEQDIAALEDKSSRTAQRLHQQRRQLNQVQQQLQQKRQGLEKRLAALYKNQGNGLLPILFGDQPWPQRQADLALMRRILRHDQKLLKAYQQQRQQKKQLVQQLEQTRQKQRRLRQKLQQQKQQLVQQQHQKRQLLAQIEKQAGSLAARKARLQARKQRLQTLVKRLERQRRANYTDGSGERGSIQAQKGQLPWPVKGDIVTAFGRQQHAQLDTEFTSHGLELNPKPGTKVRAIWPGHIIYARTFQGYGHLVIVAHDSNYYSLYARLETIKVQRGQQVQKGSVLGLPASQGAPFYFEIRQGHKPQNPRSWLAPPTS